MKRLGLLVFALSMGCLTAFAQVQDVSMSVTTVGDQPMISISNMHNLPVEAFLVTVDIAITGKHLSRVYYDIHSNYKRDVAIPPGTSKETPLPRIVGDDLPIPTLRAVVFSDGTSWGDQSWVHELLHRRNILSERIQEVIGILQKISDQKLTTSEAIDVLQQARDARRQGTIGSSLEERIWQDQIFHMAITNFKDSSPNNGKIPEPSVVARNVSQFLGGWLLDLRISAPPL